jgi:hypothetical protein
MSRSPCCRELFKREEFRETITGKKGVTGMNMRVFWYLSVSVALLIGLAAGMLLGERSLSGVALAQDSPSKSVRAQSFELVDQNNTVRGLLHLDGNEPNLELYDSRGIVRVRVGVGANDTPVVAVNGPKGKPRAGLMVPPTGEGGLVFYNEQGEVLAGKGMTSASTNTP